MLVEKYGLLGVVEGLSRGGGDGAVLVRELAREIVPVLKPALASRPGLAPRSGGRASRGVHEDSPNPSPKPVLAPKRMRRTASETSAATLGSSGSVITPPSSTARLGRPKPRQKLGDIPWQATNGGGSGGRV